MTFEDVILARDNYRSGLIGLGEFLAILNRYLDEE